jgi:DNA-binding winged helix-turn-helix (wHTH) protein
MQRFFVMPAGEEGPRFYDRRTIGDQAAGAIDALETIEFGRFQVLPRSRQLLADGMPVAIGARAFDILMVLIEADGRVVAKRELMSRVWPDVVVEECNLRVQVGALRRALGEERNLVQSEPGRGYRFAATVRSVFAVPRDASPTDASQPPAIAAIGRSFDACVIAVLLARIDAKLTQALHLIHADGSWPGGRPATPPV